jgi:hypothetical protein
VFGLAAASKHVPAGFRVALLASRRLEASGTARLIAAFIHVRMETIICYSRDYMSFEDQRRKAQEQANQDRRTETINKL